MTHAKKLHVGIIPDGMRRWSKENNISLVDSYLTSLENIDNIISYFFSNDVKILSIYSLSSDNMQRDQSEVDSIIHAETLYFDKFLPEICQRWKSQFIAVGNIEVITNERFKDSILRLEQLTKNNSERKMYALINYDPIEEIISASEKISNKKNINFFDLLKVREPVDLLIRTGKVNRTSNFLPFHIGYAELRFINKLFIDTKIEDFMKVYETFNKEDRKYGK
ncbi:Isoprenyl transferase [compost metagenome]